MSKLVMDFGAACAEVRAAPNDRAAVEPYDRAMVLREQIIERDSATMAQRLQRVAQLVEGLMPLADAYRDAASTRDPEAHALAEHVDAIRKAATLP